MQVKNALFNQAYEAKYETFKTTYAVEKKDGVLNGISSVRLNVSSSSTSSLV